jgi:hypothetical protein
MCALQSSVSVVFAERPAVEPGSQGELVRALDSPHTRRQHEIVGSVVCSGQNQRAAPELRQTRLESRPHFEPARFAHWAIAA